MPGRERHLAEGSNLACRPRRNYSVADGRRIRFLPGIFQQKRREKQTISGRELTNQFSSLYADIRQRVLTRLCRKNGTIAPPEILRCTRKLLDRVLFCTFCEDRSLLPAESLKHAFQHHTPYNPHPVWQNFRGLFRAIAEGNAGLNIPAYNGGLFAEYKVLDALPVPDEVCAHFNNLGDYGYRGR